MKNIGCIKHNDGENKIEFLGSEISKEQCEYANERIEDAKRKWSHKQLTLWPK